MVYLHPILGIVSVSLVCWLALVGLRSRHRARYAHAERARHARVAPWALALWTATLAVGWASTTWLRDDLTPGATWHARVAWASLVVFGLAGATMFFAISRPWARRMHPWLGLLGVALALALAVLGMNLLP